MREENERSYDPMEKKEKDPGQIITLLNASGNVRKKREVNASAMTNGQPS